MLKYTHSTKCLLWATICAQSAGHRHSTARVCNTLERERDRSENLWVLAGPQYRPRQASQAGLKLSPELSSLQTWSIMHRHCGASADITLNSTELLQLIPSKLDLFTGIGRLTSDSIWVLNYAGNRPGQRIYHCFFWLFGLFAVVGSWSCALEGPKFSEIIIQKFTKLPRKTTSFKITNHSGNIGVWYNP